MDAGSIVVIIIFGIPVALFLIIFTILCFGVSFAVLDSATEPVSTFRNRGNRHMPYDYYDEPDGYYVTMPDGSVRID